MSTLTDVRAAVADIARLAAVSSYQLHGHAGDPDLDGVVEHLAEVLGVPIAVINLVGTDHQCYPAERGVGAPGTNVPDELSFCAYVVAGQAPLCVADASADPVFARNPLVQAGAIRSFLGVPLVDEDGFALGALSVFDTRPREFSAADEAVLQTQARLVRALLAARRHEEAHRRHSRMLRLQRDVLDAIASGRPLPEVLERLAVHVEALLEGRVLCSILLLDPDGVTLRDGAGPSLPAAYRDAIDGVHAGPHTGSCGTAVHRRDVVAVDDIATDPLWADYRDLAAEHGLAACTSVPVLGDDGAVLGTFALYRREAGPLDMVEGAAIAAVSDLARVAIERDRRRRELTRLATRDTVTGLLNRAAFLDASKALLARSPEPGTVHAVLFCDVDHFKLVNDSVGHAAGDAYLRAAAEGLHSALRPEDIVCRFAGDAFTVVLADATPDAVHTIAERVGGCFVLPVRIPGHVMHLSASTGLTTTALSGTADLDVLLRDADMAMHAAKQAGRARVQVYDAAMQARAAAHLELTLALAEAVHTDEFHLHYQPEIDTLTGEVMGFEALLRWTRPGTGAVSPADFIPVAESSGVIIDLGSRVLTDACQQLAHWRTQHAAAEALTVWVNVSPHQLTDDRFVETITDVLSRTELPGTALGLEITESAVMADPETARSTLTRLRRAGIRIAVDDFGTGHSSLSTLRTLPVDVVKIDRSFVSRLGQSSRDLRIVDAIVSMAHALELKVIAEGVEEQGQYDLLRGLGCDLVQGYLLGHPTPAGRPEQMRSQWPGPSPSGAGPSPGVLLTRAR
ncbi:diguanylate cyclase (GGDEF)-like protein [Kineococcus xinjiangensis]|uniref:Diguanylate cyclase (GGDEF)-like protein n=1 Tax=Kineococcus xinjiangensis TaxID=512762 RepID=A0A2S6IVD9_9ACTN|nr:EAL domain-containing protein [Kineococcus xinjiangensis]PPK98324.1 diguanylate cyclase (GGDEF)-like protein [Kineococcus xinjiangensis]